LESSHSSEFDDTDFSTGNLAQVTQFSLKRVLRQKKMSSLQGISLKQTIFAKNNFFFLKGNPLHICLPISLHVMYFRLGTGSIIQGADPANEARL